LDLSNTKITELPEGLNVGADLYLPSGKYISQKDLEPFKDFIFQGCSIKELETIINL